jgi:hypothetical protein
MSEEPRKRRRQRGGILDVLTSNPDSGFASDHLRLISNQISQLQEPEPTPEFESEPLPDPDIDTVPDSPPAPRAPRAFDDTRRKKGARQDKVSGLHIRLEHIKHHGFEHPLASKSFLMVPPDDFLALLSLEPLAVIQVVFVIWRETVGWEDPTGPYGRREWVGISPQDFERRGVAGRAQARRGLKRAEEQGYIRKRTAGSGFEYAMRWKRGDS